MKAHTIEEDKLIIQAEYYKILGEIINIILYTIIYRILENIRGDYKHYFIYQDILKFMACSVYQFIYVGVNIDNPLLLIIPC